MLVTLFLFVEKSQNIAGILRKENEIILLR
jgi:hypothetical protein